MLLDDDIIQDILKRVVLHLQHSSGGTFSEQMALQVMEIDPYIRKDRGGEQVKIAKRSPLLKLVRQKVRDEIGVKSPQQLQNEHGISRATLYRYIAKE